MNDYNLFGQIITNQLLTYQVLIHQISLHSLHSPQYGLVKALLDGLVANFKAYLTATKQYYFYIYIK